MAAVLCVCVTIIACGAFCVGALAQAAPPAQERPGPDQGSAATADAGPSYFLNCGVATAYFCERWFGRSSSMEDTAQALDAGDLMQSECSFADIAAALGKSGLACTGMKAENVVEAVGLVKPPDVGILRLSRVIRGEDRGHFVVVVPLKGWLAVVDPPRKPVVLSGSEVQGSDALSGATGELLLVSDTAAEVRAKGPSLEADTLTIDLGRIPIGTNKFEGAFRFRNAGSEELRILDAKVSCGCMSKPTGDFSLAPGKSGKLEVGFERATSGHGENTRELLLATNDPAHAQLLVRLQFFLVVAPEKLDANITPRQIDYGREAVADISQQTGEFVLRLPMRSRADFDRLTVQPKTDTDGLEVTQTSASFSETRAEEAPATKTASTEPAPTEQRAGVATLKFRMRWAKPPAIGEFKNTVSFTVSPSELGFKQFEVPLRGEAY